MANKLIPQEVEAIDKMTLENLLMEKFRVLQLAREEGQPDLFDSVSQSIEILLKASPYAYDELMKIKEEMSQELEKEYINIQNDANKAQDEIYRQHILESRVDEADWIFRITYEETLIEVFQKYRIIGFMTTETPKVVEEAEYEPEEENDEEEMTIEEPKKKKKLKVRKPKLMRQKEE